MFYIGIHEFIGQFLFLFNFLLISATINFGCPLFQGEISSALRLMNFEFLQRRLIAHVQDRVQRGELTERGLARRTGISQPHLHNVLKGVRVLSPHIGDVLLRHLHITVLDLLREEEWTARCAPDNAEVPARTRFPAADGLP